MRTHEGIHGDIGRAIAAEVASSTSPVASTGASSSSGGIYLQHSRALVQPAGGAAALQVLLDDSRILSFTAGEVAGGGVRCPCTPKRREEMELERWQYDDSLASSLASTQPLPTRRVRATSCSEPRMRSRSQRRQTPQIPGPAEPECHSDKWTGWFCRTCGQTVATSPSSCSLLNAIGLAGNGPVMVGSGDA